MTPPGAVVVVGDAAGPAGELDRGLADRGERATVIGPRGTMPDTRWDLGPASGLAEAMEASARSLGPIRAAVWAWTEPSSTTPVALDHLDEHQWAVRAEDPIRHLLAFLQGSFDYFANRSGALVVLVPTLSLVGAPAGLAPWATAAEGQRSLAKVAARTWGRLGLTVNCVAVPPDLLADAESRQRPGLPPPALDRFPSVRTEVAAVVSSLTSADWRAVTGATVGVDGGSWMPP